MAEFEAWIGACHFRKTGIDYHAHAAVWADSAKVVQEILVKHARRLGYQLLWTEKVHRATDWMQKFPAKREAIGLAAEVHEGHHVKLSKLVMVDTDRTSEDENYLTITKHKITPLPDQTGIPFWDQEWIATDLKELLFEQPKDSEPLRTYFIVDATLRRKITGFFDLNIPSLDVPIQCLFRDEAAEELKQYAPYLIDMTLSEDALNNHAKVPDFHKDFFKKHWGKNTGIFIRSTSPMIDVCNHFRKFTRVQVKTDKRWVLFRFWDPRIANIFIPILTVNDATKFVSDFVINWETPVGIITTKIKEKLVENHDNPAKSFMLRDAYLQAFTNIEENKFLDEIKNNLLVFKADLKPDDATLIAHETVTFCQNVGLTAKDSVIGYALLRAYSGYDFINRYTIAKPLGDKTLPETQRKSLIHNLLGRLMGAP